MNEMWKEPSTWRGLSMVIGALFGFNTEQSELFITLGISIAGIISIIWERK